MVMVDRVVYMRWAYVRFGREIYTESERRVGMYARSMPHRPKVMGVDGKTDLRPWGAIFIPSRKRAKLLGLLELGEFCKK